MMIMFTLSIHHMGVEPKIGVGPKMDGLFHGKFLLKFHGFGVKPRFLETLI